VESRLQMTWRIDMQIGRFYGYRGSRGTSLIDNTVNTVINSSADQLNDYSHKSGSIYLLTDCVIIDRLSYA